MEFFGRIKEIDEVVKGTSEKGEWQRQTVVVETFEMPSTYLAIDAIGERIGKLATLQPGMAVRALFNVSSRKSEKGWFTSATLWDINKL